MRGQTQGFNDFVSAIFMLKIMGNNENYAIIDKQSCIGCGACVINCPTHAITMAADWYCVVEKNKCIGCGKCVTLCHKHAPKMSRN